VHASAPKSRLIVDANEGWTPEMFAELVPRLVPLGVEMIEQPLPANADSPLAELARPITVCADESCHGVETLLKLAGKYDAVNIKLDKTGFAVMIGCMVATSLAMAPAMLVAQRARWVDLDGPLLLARDRENGLTFDGSLVHPPRRDFWG
jgi:L-alanine-DL-glutamate epimerase-like enolase superfamily enzyme